jgi:DNA primase
MVESGVAKKSQYGKTFDPMAERVTFSIFDLYNNCIGFTGRVLPSRDNGETAKYLNTAESTVFSKGHIVYGGDVLKKHMRKEHIDNLIVVEGNVDVITLVGSGFHNTVACMGTAMTPFHVKSFQRFVKEVYLCFDGDSAGRKATLRALDIFEQYNAEQIKSNGHTIDVRVVSLPADIDPDGFVRKHGKAEFQKLLDTARPGIDYKLDMLADTINMNDNLGKTKYLKSAIEILKKIPSKMELELYIPKVAKTAGVSGQSIYREVGMKIPPKTETQPDTTKPPHIDNSREMLYNRAKAGLEQLDNGQVSGTFDELARMRKDYEQTIKSINIEKRRDELTVTGQIDCDEYREILDEIRRMKNGK